MEIIFIRHEQAEAGHADLPDRERRLSQKGQAQAQAAVVELVDYLQKADISPDPDPDPDPGLGQLGNSVESNVASQTPATVIWTSPALRAQETAQPIVEALKVAADLQDFIYSGEFSKLQAALAELPESVATLLLVGHEPILSQWIEKLTGEAVKMKKGDRASVKLDKLDGQTLEGTYQGKI